MLIRFPNRPPRRPKAIEGIDGDPLTHLDASILRPAPDVRGITTGWSVWTRLLQALIVIRPDIGDMPALDVARALQLEFPAGRRLEGASHVYAITAPLEISTPFSADGWRIVPTTLTVKTCA